MAQNEEEHSDNEEEQSDTLTDSQRWTLYKLILHVAVKNLHDEVHKPYEDLHKEPWAGYFRITGYMETLMHLVTLMPTNKYEGLLRQAMMRRGVLMWRLDIPADWDTPVIANWYAWDHRRFFADEAGLCENSGLYS